jgi:hypothetical protein
MKFNATYIVSSKEDMDYLQGRLDLLGEHCQATDHSKDPLDVLVKFVQPNTTLIALRSSNTPRFQYYSKAIDAAEMPLDMFVLSSTDDDLVNIKEPSGQLSRYMIYFHNSWGDFVK